MCDMTKRRAQSQARADCTGTTFYGHTATKWASEGELITDCMGFKKP